MKHDHSRFAAAAVEAPEVRREADARVLRFTPLVHSAARRVHARVGGAVELDDLVQAGFVALTQCARRHAGPTEDGFAAYAKARVGGAMIDWVRRAVPGSRGGAARRREAQGRAVDTTPAVARMVPLDAVYTDASLAFADNQPDPLATLSTAEDTQVLTAIVADLPERLRLVLQLYFVEELRLGEIAAVLGVSVPRVHQLKARALAMVRTRLLSV